MSLRSRDDVLNKIEACGPTWDSDPEASPNLRLPHLETANSVLKDAGHRRASQAA